jgi:uncharacterized radical SAM superfamily protein
MEGRINFYFTSNSFPAVSLTGASCALSCKHCMRKLIERLPAAEEPKKLVDLCMSFHETGARGVLFTGGCDVGGKVPLYSFLDAFREIKEKTGMLLIAHTGVLDYYEAKSLKEAGLDGVCVDVVGSAETTREIYGIELYPEDYRKTLKALERAKIDNISPHVCVGLHNGRMHHEMAALEIISAIKPTTIVIIGLTNLVGTPMADVRIRPEDFLHVLSAARERFPKTYLAVGCAHGKGVVRSEIDRLAVRAGVDAIALPTHAAYREAAALNLKVTEFGACCCLPPEQLP